MENYYSILGCDDFASMKDVKRQYKRLTALYHPDKPTADKEKYIAIQNAYNELSKNKEKYDKDLQLKAQLIEKQILGDLSDDSSDIEFDDDFDTDDEIIGNINEQERFTKEIEKITKANYRDLNTHQILFPYTKSEKAPTLDLVVDLPYKQMITGCNYKLVYNILRICPHCNGNIQLDCRLCKQKRVINIERKIIIPIPPYTFNSSILLKNMGNQTPYYTGVGDLRIYITQKRMEDWYFDKYDNLNYDLVLSQEMVVPYFDNSEIRLNQKMIRDNKIVIKEKGWFSKSGRKTDVIIHIKKQNKDSYTKFLGILLLVAIVSCLFLLLT
jgi:DNAJ homolog subfamily A member 1, putative